MLPQITQHAKAPSLLDAALDLAGRGFAVFPVKAGDKVTRVKHWPGLASSDPKTVKRFWAEYGPDSNIGIFTGAPFHDDYLIVIDVDTRDGKQGFESLAQLEAEHGKLPPTWRVRTWSGGEHIFYRSPVPVGSSNRGEFARDIDIKSSGGYVLGMGSIIRGKAYVAVEDSVPIADAPAWVVERACKKTPERKRQRDNVVPIRLNLPSNIERAIDYLKRSAPLAVDRSYGDNTTYVVACKLKDYGLDESACLKVMLEHWNDRCLPPWPLDELTKKVRNAFLYGLDDPGCEAPEAQFEPIPDAPDATDKKHIVLSPGAPMEAAGEFMRARYTVDKLPTLHHHGGEFYSWQNSHYAETSPDSVTAEMYRFMAGAYQHDKEKQTLVRYHPTQTRVSNALHALKAVAHLSLSVQAPAWLSDQVAPPGELIACANGLLHVPSRRLIPHSPAYFNRNALAFDYDPAAAEPGEWLRFLDSVWPDDPEAIGTLQEIMGYLLTADTSQQKLFMLVGPKRSGKGTIARVVSELVGRENAVGPTLGSLAGQFGLAPLIGKQVAVIADARLGGRADQHAIAERLLSISGEDTLTIDRKFRDPYTGRLFTRFLIMSNELPRLADASGALSSRFVLLAMRTSFYGREDSGLTARLLGELPGILNWSLVGLDRLRQRGYFVQPASSREAIEDLDALTSPIGAFIKECCELGPACETTTDALYDGWRHWCGKQGREHPGSKASFGRDLMAAAPALKKSRIRHGAGRAHAYQGIRLLVDEWGNPIGEK